MPPYVVNVLIALAAAGALLWLVGTFNHVVRLRNQVDRAFGDVDVLLKQRHDELPQLVSVCKAHMEHERGTLERVTALRGNVATAGLGLAERIGLENQLGFLLGGFGGLVEGYPDLEADDTLRALQQRLSDLEDGIADRRELFNDSVTAYNDYIGQLPGLLFARPLGYRPLPVLEFAAEREAPPVELQTS